MSTVTPGTPQHVCRDAPPFAVIYMQHQGVCCPVRSWLSCRYNTLVESDCSIVPSVRSHPQQLYAIDGVKEESLLLELSVPSQR